MIFEYWFMLPVAVLVATVAMASGVEGATFFTPLFLLALRLPPEVAIGTGLITEAFGFGSGLHAYGRKRLIDYRLGSGLLGTWLSARLPPDVLRAALGIGLVILAISFLKPHSPARVSPHPHETPDRGKMGMETCLVTADGEAIRYTPCHQVEARLITGVGGLFLGLVSTGLGEMNGYFLLRRCRAPGRVAVATSVFVVAMTALVASAGHLVGFIQAGSETLDLVLRIVLFTVPGVVVGARLGARESPAASPRRPWSAAWAGCPCWWLR